ncbi:hypothetical protein ACDL92_10555 [Ihubacter sp. mB4P-1]|uniref:hypothetical protein n=1 Tax=Ihubacter sp. mB4P-1 TaxID=3242370 RepID=UPI003C7D2161
MKYHINYIKIIMTIVLSAAIFMIIIAICKTDELPEHICADAKVVRYEDTDDLIDKADVIAVCEKVSEGDSIVEKNEQGDLIAVYTLSTVNVKSIEKGNLNDKQITIMESEGYVKELNKVYHIAGYEKMKRGNSYLLLLRKSETDSWYIPLGVNFGKIPLDKSERIMMEGTDTRDISDLKAFQSTVKEKIYEK